MNTPRATLTPEQRRGIEQARALLTAAEGGASTLAAEVKKQSGKRASPGDPYPAAFGVARNHLERLLDIIDGLTGPGAS